MGSLLFRERRSEEGGGFRERRGQHRNSIDRGDSIIAIVIIIIIIIIITCLERTERGRDTDAASAAHSSCQSTFFAQKTSTTASLSLLSLGKSRAVPSESFLSRLHSFYRVVWHRHCRSGFGLGIINHLNERSFLVAL